MKKLYVGVDLGGTNVRAGLITGDGEILCTDSRKTCARESAEAPVRQIVDSINATLKEGGVQAGDITGIGIGSPGPLDARKGTILRAGNLPHWTNFPLTDTVKERTGIDTYLQNDANVFALGEWWMGAGRGFDDFFAITLGTGIGGGAIVGGRLLTGFNDNASEFGHTTIDYDGAQDWCGQRGCIELYASATGFVRITREALINEHIETSLAPYRTRPDELDSEVIYKAAAAGDKFAVSMFDQAGFLLGVALVNALNILNFQRVAIGGGLAQSGDLIFNPIKRAMHERGFQSFIDEVSVVPAERPDVAAMLGAVKMVIEREKEG